MSFIFSESHIDDYFRLGVTVFRAVVPPSLIGELRRETDKAREIARQRSGARAQRLQPIGSFDVDHRPFREYAQLPELNDAIHRVLTPEHAHGHLDALGVLLEPAKRPWTTGWHRDITIHSPNLDPVDFETMYRDTDCFNQINCPLYDDDCTWIVPGSVWRMEDLPSEAAAARSGDPKVLRGEADLRNEEIERLCLEHCLAMPGAVQLHLAAGDFAIYRPTAWHLGNYVPYRKRATLHDAMFPLNYERWWKAWRRGEKTAFEPRHGVRRQLQPT